MSEEDLGKMLDEIDLKIEKHMAELEKLESERWKVHKEWMKAREKKGLD